MTQKGSSGHFSGTTRPDADRTGSTARDSRHHGRVGIPAPLRAAILAHAAENPREEVCGLLGGRGGRLLHAYRGRNIAADRRCRFFLDPHSQLAALRTMGARGEFLLGIYHSHVSGPAYPSAADRELNAYPDTCWVIVSLTAATTAQLRAFLLAPTEVRELQIDVLPA